MKQETTFKETVIGLIPEDWEVKEIQEVSTKLGDGLHGTPKYDENGDYYFINGNNLVEGKIEFNHNTKKCSVEEYRKYKKDLNERTILVSINGTLGNIAIYNGEKVILGKSACYFHVKNEVDINYIIYVLKNKYFQKYIEYHATGTTIKNVSLKQMREFKFGIPTDLKEQNEIANFFHKIDLKINLNNQMNKTLELIGQKLFKKWFIEFEFPNDEGKPYKAAGGEMVDSELGDIPKGWKISSIGEQLKTVLGGTPSKSKEEYWVDGTVNWINSGAINDFPIVKASEKITQMGLENSAADLMPIRTVVLPFVISLGKEVKISILGIESSGNQSVLGIIENDKFGAGFIYYWIQFMKREIYSWATGGAQQHINKGNVDKTRILVPDADILKKYGTLFNPIVDRIIYNALENIKLSNIRDSLLPKLMTGKIRVPL